MDRRGVGVLRDGVVRRQLFVAGRDGRDADGALRAHEARPLSDRQQRQPRLSAGRARPARPALLWTTPMLGRRRHGRPPRAAVHARGARIPRGQLPMRQRSAAVTLH